MSISTSETGSNCLEPSDAEESMFNTCRLTLLYAYENPSNLTCLHCFIGYLM